MSCSQLVSAEVTSPTCYSWSCILHVPEKVITMRTLCCVSFVEEPVSEPEPEQSSSHEERQQKPEEPKQDRGARRPKKKYECTTCGRFFPHNTALQRHLVVHSGKRPYKCFICGRGFTQSGNLKTHMKVHRGQCFAKILCTQLLFFCFVFYNWIQDKLCRSDFELPLQSLYAKNYLSLKLLQRW